MPSNKRWLEVDELVSVNFKKGCELAKALLAPFFKWISIPVFWG